MLKLNTKLRIGEKIGLGFVIIGLLFLAVVWQYHVTLNQTLFNYQRLHNIDEATKSHALKIANSIQEARVSEKEFLIQRDESAVNEVFGYIQEANRLVTGLSNIENATGDDASKIAELLKTYQEHFSSVVTAWKIMGLDHDSGLQGAFRESVHELETIAGQFNTGPLYLKLLQLRNTEKDFDFKQDKQHYTMLLRQIEDFKQLLTDSKLNKTVSSVLLDEINVYHDVVENHYQNVLSGEEVKTGQNQSFQADNRMEAILNQYYVQDLESNILQLRRREKDYLLRHDKQYVDMALQEIKHINEKIDISLITDDDKKHIKTLIDKYQQDFLSLVSQNDHINQLIEQMSEAVENINQLVQLNVIAADRTMDKGFSDVNAVALENERFMYWIVAVATFLAFGFAFFLTNSIARPLRKMVGLLDKLAYEEPTERMPFDSKGRDEVNAMAISLNTIADHKKRFIDWWKTSMAKEDACERLKRALMRSTNEIPVENLEEVSDELKMAIVSKKGLSSKQCQGIEQLSSTITETTEVLLRNIKPTGETLLALDSIRHSAQSIKNLLEMLSIEPTHKFNKSC